MRLLAEKIPKVETNQPVLAASNLKKDQKTLFKTEKKLKSPETTISSPDNKCGGGAGRGGEVFHSSQ